MRQAGRAGAVAVLVGGLAACSDDLQVEVSVAGAETVAALEIVDARVYSGELENDEGLSELVEDAVLPVTFTVPPGEYVVVAGQGTCSGQETVTLTTEDVVVELALSCPD